MLRVKLRSPLISNRSARAPSHLINLSPCAAFPLRPQQPGTRELTSISHPDHHHHHRHVPAPFTPVAADMSSQSYTSGTSTPSILQPPHMISLPMYFTSSPHSGPSSPSAHVDYSLFPRPATHTTESSSSTATVSSTSSASSVPRSMPPLRQRSSFDPLTLPSFVPAAFASSRDLDVDTGRLAASKTGRPRSISHSHPEDVVYETRATRAASHPATSPGVPHSGPALSAFGHSFASLHSKTGPVGGLRTDRLSNEVRLEMSMFRD